MSDYTYDAVLVSIHDGDTITVNLDLGFDTWVHHAKVRVYGINSPELKTEEGKKSLAFIQTLLKPGDTCVLTTIKDRMEKYGRYLAKVTLKDGRDLSATMILAGYAKAYFGEGPKPI